MLICLATYEDRLASLFENASSFKLYDIKDGKAAPAGDLTFSGLDAGSVATALADSGAELLVCGGISGTSLTLLEQHGVTAAPWIRGGIEEVLAAVADENLDALAMPGAQGAAGRGMGRGGRGLGYGGGRGMGCGGGRGMGGGRFAMVADAGGPGSGLGLGPCGLGHRRGNGPRRQSTLINPITKPKGNNS